jgi:hypothetical protein
VKGKDFFHAAVLGAFVMVSLLCFGLACFHDKGRGSGEEGPLQPDYFNILIFTYRNWFNKKGRELHDGSETFFLGLEDRLCRCTTVSRLYSITNGQRIS